MAAGDIKILLSAEDKATDKLKGFKREVIDVGFKLEELPAKSKQASDSLEKLGNIMDENKNRSSGRREAIKKLGTQLGNFGDEVGKAKGKLNGLIATLGDLREVFQFGFETGKWLVGANKATEELNEKLREQAGIVAQINASNDARRRFLNQMAEIQGDGAVEKFREKRLKDINDKIRNNNNELGKERAILEDLKRSWKDVTPLIEASKNRIDELKKSTSKLRSESQQIGFDKRLDAARKERKLQEEAEQKRRSSLKKGFSSAFDKVAGMEKQRQKVLKQQMNRAFDQVAEQAKLEEKAEIERAKISERAARKAAKIRESSQAKITKAKDRISEIEKNAKFNRPELNATVSRTLSGGTVQEKDLEPNQEIIRLTKSVDDTQKKQLEALEAIQRTLDKPSANIVGV